MLGNETHLSPLAGYVISFVAFHERGFGVPMDAFIRSTLLPFDLELQHLNPNDIQQMVAFKALCEGFLACEAHWKLF